MSVALVSPASPAVVRPATQAVPAPADPKIKPRHLAKQAFIYVRQSSPGQVQRHPESARRQYALAQRAERLGWPGDQVVIIDEDQGKSAAGSAAAHDRDGFARLVSSVGLGEVGLILALEVARLARNSAEWYRLLELATLGGVLIADEDAIYDPRDFNDRLLLGLRGTISEVELHCIQARLHGARMSKVRRGEFPLLLPVGYVRNREGQVELDPDEEVQGTIRTIFAQFARLGTVTAVLRFFRDHGLRMPRRPWGGPQHQQLVWVRPTYQTIHLVVSNPVYAGAYTYGRRRRDDEVGAGLGAPGPRRRFALDELEVLIHDHHSGYLSWEQYLANRARLRDNSRRFASSRGAPRQGQALLQGIVVCGRCGCRMRPHYSASSPTYWCISRQRYGDPICQALTISHVDQAVSEAFLAVVRPAEVEAALLLAEELARDQVQVERQWRLRLERARYEAERAFRQFDQVEPENRLVARELERRWNEKLRAAVDLDAEFRQEQAKGLSPLTDAEKATLRQLVSDLPALWRAPETTAEERKRLLRCLVSEVILERDEGRRGAGGVTSIRIGWRSGACSELAVHRPTSGEHSQTADVILQRIRALAEHESDDRIAAVLNTEGLTTQQGLPWTYQRVQRLRRYHQIPTECPLIPRGPAARGDGLVPLRAAATTLGVTPSALDHWQRWGFLTVAQHGKLAPLWVRLTEEDQARLDGTLAAQGFGRWRLHEARRVLELSNEQLWERARRGELVAYRAHVADHWEWRVSPATQAGTPTVLPPDSDPFVASLSMTV